MKWAIEYHIESEDQLPGELLEQIKDYLKHNIISKFKTGTVETLMFYSESEGLRVPVSVRQKEMDGGDDLLVEIYPPRGIEEVPLGIDENQDAYLREIGEGTWSEQIEKVRRRTEQDRTYAMIEEVHRYFPPFQHVFESGEHTTTFDVVRL